MMTRFYLRLVALLAGITSTTAVVAERSLEAGMFQYQDHDRRSVTTKAQGQYLWRDRDGKAGRETALQLGLERRSLQFRDPSSFVVREQLKGRTSDEQNTLSIAVDHGLGGMRTAGLSGGYAESQLGRSYHYQATLSDWFREDTLQLRANIGQSESEQISAIVYDTISRRIRLPENIRGNSLSLAVMHLTTPRLILNGDYTMMQRSDRPHAHAVNAAGRYFFPRPHATIQLGGSYFANSPGLKETSLYGLVEAYAVTASWQQRLHERWVLGLGYRYYREWTAARHDDEDASLLVSDSPSALLRYRWGNPRWIEAANEAYLLWQRYHTNEPRRGELFGIGHLWRLQ